MMGCSSKFSDLCVQRPSLVMLITFLGSMLLTALAMTDFPALAQGGMEASDSLVQKRVTAANMLTVKRANATVRTSYLYYDAAAGNALTEENLRKVCKFESAMFHHAAYRALCTTEVATGNCAAMPSLVTLLFTQDNIDADGNTCIPSSLGVVSLGSQRCMTTCALNPDWQFHLKRLANPSLAANESVQVYNMYKQYGAAFVGNDISTDGSTVYSRYVRSKVTTEDYQETVKEVLDPVARTEGLDSSSKLRVYYQDDDAFLNVLIQDMMLAAASIIIVFLYMWFNTQSLFLTICGLFEIIISFPIAFFVWGVMLGQEHYTILQMMTLFILLGIGADDIFVLQDAWRQSAAQPRQISGTKLARFEWAYNRASNAMLSTTFTTFMAFVSTALLRR